MKFSERNIAISELAWRYEVAPTIINLSSSFEPLVAVACGLRSDNHAGGEPTERICQAAVRARDIDRQLGALPAHHRNVLRYRFDVTSWRSRQAVQAKGMFGQLAGVVVLRCKKGTDAERRARAETLFECALEKFAESRRGKV